MISRRISWGLAVAAAVFATGAAAQQGYGYDYGNNGYGNNGYGYDGRTTIRCESQDERTRYCTADIRGGVRLVNQLSRSSCIEGRSWGYDQRGIWVSDGCRADFAIDSYGYGNDDYYGRGRDGYGRNRVIRCESTNSRTVYCNVDTRYGVRLLAQHSRAQCVEGRTWGWNSRGVWVSRGCRAQFQIGGRGYDDRYGYGNGNGYGYGNGGYGYGNNGGGYGSGYGYGGGQRITCQSQDGRYNFCRISGGYLRQAQVVRQMSQSECRYNYSWGFRSDGVWVDRGCRAEFEIY
jgi:hypothetical protein